MFLEVYILLTSVVTESCVKNSLYVRRTTSLNMSRKNAVILMHFITIAHYLVLWTRAGRICRVGLSAGEKWIYSE